MTSSALNAIPFRSVTSTSWRSLWRSRRLLNGGTGAREQMNRTCVRERGSRRAARAAWSLNACACAAERESRHRRQRDLAGETGSVRRTSRTDAVSPWSEISVMSRRVEARIVAVGRRTSATRMALSASGRRSRRFPRRAASARHRYRRCRDRRPRRSRRRPSRAPQIPARRRKDRCLRETRRGLRARPRSVARGERGGLDLDPCASQQREERRQQGKPPRDYRLEHVWSSGTKCLFKGRARRGIAFARMNPSGSC